MIMKSPKTENMKRFTKVIHEKMKTNNIFNDSNPNTMFRWASIIAANFQIGTVSPIKNWVSAFKECKALRSWFIFHSWNSQFSKRTSHWSRAFCKTKKESCEKWACESKTQQATIFGNYQEFTSKAKEVYTKKLKKKNLPESSQKSSR